MNEKFKITYNISTNPDVKCYGSTVVGVQDLVSVVSMLITQHGHVTVWKYEENK